MLDTGVIVSAMMGRDTPPRRAFELAFERHTVLTSYRTWAEFLDVIERPKLVRYFSAAIRERTVALFEARAELIVPTIRVSVCRDPQDDQFLELAVGGAADAIVTGDSDLLVLNPFGEVAILSPAAFLTFAPSWPFDSEVQGCVAMGYPVHHPRSAAPRRCRMRSCRVRRPAAPGTLLK